MSMWRQYTCQENNYSKSTFHGGGRNNDLSEPRHLVYRKSTVEYDNGVVEHAVEHGRTR